MNLTDTELSFLTSLLGHHIIGEGPRGLFDKLAAEAERRQLGLIQSAQGDAGESARAFAAAFDLLDQIDRLWELLK